MARARNRHSPARRLAVDAARTAHDRHCTDVVVLDLREISPVTDYFVIVTGTSDRQMRSVAEEVVADAVRDGQGLFKAAGMDTGKWILLDFFDVVMHLFDEEHRRFYDLELIWGDAPRVRWRAAAAKALDRAKGVKQ